jgi:hypothetical protein
MSVFGLSICHRPCLSLLYRFHFIDITMRGGAGGGGGGGIKYF